MLRRTRLRLSELGALLALWLFSPEARAQQDRRLVWQTISTPHFHIHFYQDEEPIAQRVAVLSEAIVERLAGPLGWRQSGITEIVLSDVQDDANGSAIATPYNTVRLYLTAPDDLSTLNQFDDWFTSLITHEYTHILHTDQISGVAAIFNAIFGKQWSPNQVQPRWVLEGLAVYEESLHTRGGRLRSTTWDMFLRADTLANNLVTLDQLSSGANRWPHGNIWYLYGSYFMQYVADRFGAQALAEMIADYGGTLVPYQLGRTVRRQTGYDWQTLYDDFTDALRARYAAQTRAITARGLTDATRLTTQGEDVHTPRFLPDGTVLYESSDGQSQAQIRALEPTTDTPRSLDWLASGSGFTNLDDRALIVSDLGPHRETYFFHDLYRWTLERDSDHHLRVANTERLTDGWRTQQPDLHPDGDHVVFTVNHRGTTSLFEMSLTDRAPHLLYRPRRFEQVYAPRYSPDGRTVAFSYWRTGGFRDVVLLDRESRQLREVTHDTALDLSPVWSPDGRHLLFTSDRSGVMNVYAHEVATGRLRQVTNVVLGAFQPAISPDQNTLVYVGYTHRGYDLYRMPFDPSQWREVGEPHDTMARPGVDREVPLGVPLNEPDAPVGTPHHYTPTPFNPWPTLRPRTWQADLTSDGYGLQGAVRLIGQDVLGRHLWNARVGVGLVRGDPQFDATYVYRGARPQLRLHAYRTVDAAGNYRVGRSNVSWPAERIGGESEVSVVFPALFESHALSFAYEAQYVHALGGLPGLATRQDPNEGPPVIPFQGFTSGVRASWSFNRSQRYTYSITAQEGFNTFVSLHWSDPLLGSSTGGIDISAAVAGYIPMPWGNDRRRHILALRLAGGIGTTDRGERGIFSLGGFPSFAPAQYLDAIRLGYQGGSVALRGYAPQSRGGSQYALATAEYRFPVLQLQRGSGTIPLFIQRITGDVFCDVGQAGFGAFRYDRIAVGSGAEILIDLVVGFVLPFTIRTGYAHGFMEDGEDQVYSLLSSPF